MSSQGKSRLICFPRSKKKVEEADVFDLKPMQSFLRFGPLTLDTISETEFYCVETDEQF